MPALAYDRPSVERMRAKTVMHMTPTPSYMQTTFKKAARLPPRHRNGSVDGSPPCSTSSSVSTAPSSTSSSSSSVAGISIMKPTKLSSSSSLPPTSSSSSSSRFLRRRSPSLDFGHETPFEAHLQDIYSGRANMDDGLEFFESHGYYDVCEANTVDMFRQNFGMKKQFWDGGDHDLVFYEEMNLDTVDLAGLQVLSVGGLLSKNVKRHRTISGRFQLLDDEGNEVDAEAQLEAEKEKRMKLKHMELDDDDLADLAQEQLVLAQAITVIRTEQTRFKRYFYQACTDEMNAAAAAAAVVVPQAMPALDFTLPSYSGYLYVLKDTIPHLFRSWHKRWVYLDFQKGLAQMYKRSYWKSPRGVLDMRSVSNLTRMNENDICIQCYDGRTMLLRTKDGVKDADLWLNVLQAARRQVGNTGAVIPSPNTLQLAPPMSVHEKLTTMTTTTTTTTMAAGSVLISTKIGAQRDHNMLDIMAVLLQAKTTSSSTSSTSLTANNTTMTA